MTGGATQREGDDIKVDQSTLLQLERSDWCTAVMAKYACWLSKLTRSHGRSVMMSGALVSDAEDREAALGLLPLDEGLVLLLTPEDADGFDTVDLDGENRADVAWF